MKNTTLGGLALAFWAAVFCLPSSAQIAEPILGVRLGQPLEGQFQGCTPERQNWCKPHPEMTGFTSLNPPFPHSTYSLPTWVRPERIYVSPNDGGNIEKFTVKTYGPEVQDRAVESIAKRFGKPTTLNRTLKQTPGGATVEVVAALWKTLDTVVIHDCSQLTTCTVSFYTAEAYARFTAELARRQSRDGL